MTTHDICANSAHDPVCEQLMDAHDIYANSALGYANIVLSYVTYKISENHGDCQSRIVFCACSKGWLELSVIGDRSMTLLRPL